MPGPDCFKVYFDASNKPPDFWFVLPGLFFIAIGAGLMFFRKAPFMPAMWRGPKAWRSGSGVFFLGFACLWTLLVSVAIFGGYISTRVAETSGRVAMVQGPVEDFHPMPAAGHDLEHFTVQGVYFAYSDYVVTSGFNQTSSHGGPMQPELYVRIRYLQDTDHTIVRLEIPCVVGPATTPS